MSGTDFHGLPPAGQPEPGDVFALQRGEGEGSTKQATFGDMLAQARAGARVVTESSTTRTALPEHAGDYTRFTAAGAKTYSFDAAQPYPVGAEYHGRNAGTGNLVLTTVGAFVLNPPYEGTLEIPPGGTFTVKIVAASEADVFGITEAA